MQIEKVLIVESPVRLWKIMDSRPEILDRAQENVYFQLKDFMDRVDLFINGCKCDEEENYSAMMEQYAAIQSPDISEHLCRCIECDRIDFK